MSFIRDVDFDDIFQYRPVNNPYETRMMDLETRTAIISRILFVIAMQDKETYRYDGRSDGEIIKIVKRKLERLL